MTVENKKILKCKYSGVIVCEVVCRKKGKNFSGSWDGVQDDDDVSSNTLYCGQPKTVYKGQEYKINCDSKIYRRPGRPGIIFFRVFQGILWWSDNQPCTSGESGLY